VDSSLRFPFSGAVTQSINPWDFWIRSLSSQLGFINIRNVTSSDYRIEKEIIEDVASYGRQLGQIADALTAVIRHFELDTKDTLQEDRKEAIGRFNQMVSDIEQIKKKWTPFKNVSSEIDTLLAGLKALKTKSPDNYEAAVNKIRQGLEVLEAGSG
jgi:hypothetical protein